MSAAPGFAELLSMAEDNSRRNMKEVRSRVRVGFLSIFNNALFLLFFVAP